MSDRYCEKVVDAQACQTCPARNNEVFIAQLRGSSFAGRPVEPGEKYTTRSYIVTLGEVILATVQIANNNLDSSQQDAQAIVSSFEANLTLCDGPDSVTIDGQPQTFCAPINRAIDEFVHTNYPIQ